MRWRPRTPTRSDYCQQDSLRNPTIVGISVPVEIPLAGILTTDALKQYTQSIGHYLDAAKRMNVDVELQNHPIFDGMPDKLAKLKSAKASDPNPFVIGNDRYLKMWNIISECIQAEIARREGSN